MITNTRSIPVFYFIKTPYHEIGAFLKEQSLNKNEILGLAPYIPMFNYIENIWFLMQVVSKDTLETNYLIILNNNSNYLHSVR